MEWKSSMPRAWNGNGSAFAICAPMSLIGYRWWYSGVRPAEGWRLRSAFRDVWWDGPHLTASAPPEPGNACGIHAFKTWTLAVRAAKELDEFPCEGSYAVLGTVALWGKVVEHERGFRAEHALVQQLWVPERILLTVRRPEERYGCLFSCLLEVDEDESTTRQVPEERTPEPGLGRALARLYGVDVEVDATLVVQMVGR